MKNSDFPKNAICEWEANDGVDFAVALARITGWILQVDWLTPSDNKEIVENMRSLRVYVSNNSNQMYDFTGIHSLEPFIKQIIVPIFKERGTNYKGVVTRYYSESKLFSLPLRIKPDEFKIKASHELIMNNKEYLNRIPKRQMPNVPAHIAANYTFGLCNPFATALSDILDYKPIAMIAREYNRFCDMGKLGYVHSFTLDKDGYGIDIWGKDTIDNIAQRFGIIKYNLSETEHFTVGQALKQNSPEKYKEYYEESVAIIKKYFV